MHEGRTANDEAVHDASSNRFVIGLWGLALLRGWPLLEILELREPLVPAGAFRRTSTAAIREAAGAAFTGLPMAIIWLARKP